RIPGSILIHPIQLDEYSGSLIESAHDKSTADLLKSLGATPGGERDRLPSVRLTMNASDMPLAAALSRLVEQSGWGYVIAVPDAERRRVNVQADQLSLLQSLKLILPSNDADASL